MSDALSPSDLFVKCSFPWLASGCVLVSALYITCEGDFPRSSRRGCWTACGIPPSSTGCRISLPGLRKRPSIRFGNVSVCDGTWGARALINIIVGKWFLQVDTRMVGRTVMVLGGIGSRGAFAAPTYGVSRGPVLQNFPVSVGKGSQA